MIALQLRRSQGHRCHVAHPPIVGQRDPAAAQSQHGSDARRELGQRIIQVVARGQNLGES